MVQETALIDSLDRAWRRGLKDRKHKVIFEQFRTTSAIDGALAYEIRYLPSLTKKSSAMTSRNASRDASDAESDREAEDERSAQHSKQQMMSLVTKNGRLATSSSPDGAHTSNTTSEEPPKRDPFAPPRDNIVKEYAEYTLVLNMYPLERYHFLCVTNDFIPQTGRLRPQDLVQMWQILGELAPDCRPYGFFNSGEKAGASQQHRHMQFMRVSELDAAKKGLETLPEAIMRLQHVYESQHADVFVHPDLPAAHFLVMLPEGASQTYIFKQFNRLHELAQEAYDASITGDTHKDESEEMPYNFLMTKRCMMILPRSTGAYEGCGVGGTCLVGCLCVENQDDVELLKQAGFRAIMKHVGISFVGH
ncbi:hypothetical protein BCR37DRAFT_380163 [Protomyces lactucae-debilis]|uniref:Uncharacterized protein n=1 Tax=Protomyces lactucae-debilis TaxID=2754530 RepID=A0A1Y2FDG1_PROLT|nr:uncharacterized protein BCR37DRAFT_380163 [Protomyces lactucae-debilis]ORY81356.1 hypothetical protein BCR37DRAFT_380163 [Protomyces lactucae-debilis]